MAMSPSLPGLVLLGLSLLSLAALAPAKVVRYELNVTYGFASPDCVLKQVPVGQEAPLCLCLCFCP